MTALTKNILILAGELISAFICMPIAVKLAHFHGFTDKPDRHLKAHDEETPHIGGIVIFVHIIAVAVAYHFLLTPLTLKYTMELGLLLVIFMIGIIDDRLHLSVALRLLIQAIVAISFMLLGNMFTPLNIPALNAIITFIGIMAMINALNFLDIMDGLAGIVSFFAILGLVSTLLYYRLSTLYAMIGIATLIALVPFLIANFRPNPYKTFLGDGGSTYLGTLIAFLFIHATQARGESDTVSSLLFISIPLFELSFVTIIRMYQKKNPLKGSPDHFPLRLRRVLVSQTATIVYIAIVALLTFMAGVSILFATTVLKYILGISVIVLYVYLWIRLARVNME